MRNIYLDLPSFLSAYDLLTHPCIRNAAALRLQEQVTDMISEVCTEAETRGQDGDSGIKLLLVEEDMVMNDVQRSFYV